MRLVQKITRMEGFRSPVRRLIAQFCGEVTSMPGCPAIGVSHGVYKMVGEKGHGEAAFLERARQMRDLGYCVMLCTVVADNAAQIRILEKVNAIPLHCFHNRQTGNPVRIYLFQL